MTARRAAVALAALAVLATALVPAPAAAQELTPGAACSEAQDAGDGTWLVVGYLPEEGELLLGERAIYPDTEFDLVVCRNAQKKTFELADNDGLSLVGERPNEFRATVRVDPEAAGTTVDVSSDRWINGTQELAGLEITVPSGASVASNASGTELPFAGAAAAEGYRSAEAAFLSNLSAVEDGVADVEAMAAAARDDSLDLAAANNSSVSAPVAALERANETLSGDLSSRLHRAAWRTDNGGEHLDELRRLEDAAAANETALRDALTDYEGALAARESAAAGDARGDLLTGLVAGLLVGVVAGVVRVYRKYGSEAYDRQFTRDAGLDAGVLLLPGVAAALALVATLVAVELQFGLGAFIGAIL